MRIDRAREFPGGEAGLSKEGNGAQEWNRTTDTAIFSRMLYQLSYLGAGDAKAASLLVGAV